MTAIKTTLPPETPREEDLRRGIELLFFAYRDFTAEADAVLAAYHFGRAHHRVIYFVGRHPMISVNELLGILRITKQSLSRVLSQLQREGFVAQRPGARDRRQRLLELTGKGIELESLLTGKQCRRLAAAYHSAGAGAVKGCHDVLLGMIDAPDRDRFSPYRPS